MWEVFRTDPQTIGATVVYCVIALAILGAVGIKAWRKNEANKRDAELKLEMIARGMSAADIERVLAAKTVDSKLAETTYQKQ